MLALRDDGKAVGSVFGGCIEDDLSAEVRRPGIAPRDSGRGRPSVIEYGVTADEVHRIGLPCGGTIRLVQEALDPAGVTADLVEKVSQGRLVARMLDMETGRVTLRSALATDDARFDGRTLTTVHGPGYRMLLVGGGQRSRYAANIAVGLDSEVTVCDPRDEYGDDWHLPNVSWMRTMSDDTVMDMCLDVRSAVVALPHDPNSTVESHGNLTSSSVRRIFAPW
jgi:xanthine dehydrogenase accessory factor